MKSSVARSIDTRFRRHLILSMCLVGALVLVGTRLAVGVGPFAILGGAFCLVMMASMVWMMVTMARGHGY